MFNNSFSENRFLYKIMEKNDRARQARDDYNMAHTFYMLDN
jgi:hypothetical protein